ncbi:MAG TPA: nuclear transport factor 2 family protein [Thermoplasmata archaeon]|nr:nuclear transport factor 2 family protein [Thermoplasmata archaeon]
MPTVPEGDPADRQELERLNEQYIAAFLNGDAEWYREHLADDFVCIESDGSILNKAEFVRSAAKGPDVASYRLEKVRVRIYGEVALVQATGRWVRPDGSAGGSRYIDVYVRAPTGWRTVSAQVTRTAVPQ